MATDQNKALITAPVLQAIGASLRVMCRAKKEQKARGRIGFFSFLLENQLGVWGSGGEAFYFIICFMDGIVHMYQLGKKRFFL